MPFLLDTTSTTASLRGMSDTPSSGRIAVYNSSNYLNSSSPYVTPYEERIKEKHENRKKWLNPKGFISSVNKYSGIPRNAFVLL